ncbi:MAG: O-antigen ligase family protein, partial [Clostridia bacterium]
MDLNGITTIITSLIRPLFAGILFIILLLHKDNLKKEKLLFIIILILTVIFSGLHLVNISDYFYSKSAGSLFNEVRILLTCFYFLLMFINLFIIFKITSKKEKQLILKCLVLVGVLISILYFCSIIFKTSQLTYGIGTTKGGFKGWSMSSHYVGHSLLLLMPIVYYVCIIKKLFSSKILNYIIPIFVIIPGFYLVGTKCPTYSLLLLTSIFFILEVLNAIICKKVRSSLFYSLFLTLLLFITLPSTHAYNNMQIQIENSKGDVGNVDFVPKPPTNNVILPEVKYENEFDKRLSSVLKGENLIGDNVFDNREIQLKINLNLRKISPTKDKILGYGYNNMERNTWVETESVSLYFSFGIVLFILIIVFPYLFVGLIGLMNLFKDKKTFTLKLFAAASLFMSLFIISVVGYTLYFAQTNFYLAILLIVIYSIFNEKKGEFKKNINIEEDVEMDNTLMLQKGKKYLFMISDMNIGGAEVGLVDVLNELSIDNTVDLVLLRKRGPLLARLSPKINVFGILKDSRSKFLNEIVRYLYFAGGIFTKFVYSLTIKEKYDVEVAYLEGYPAVFISNSTNKESIKIASIRVGLKNHQLTIEKFAYGRHLLKTAYKKVDKIHCVSELTKNEFDEKFPKFKYKTKCIFTYFNIESIKKRSNEKIDFSYDLKAFNFLAVGRFDEQKGYDQLVYAFKSLLDKKANVYLHILGKNDTEYGIKIKEIIKKLGIDANIILHGVVENPYPYIKE